MPEPPSPTALGLPERLRLLREDRAFALLFGGYAVELPEATLVVNERVPVPRFNYAQDVRVSRGRTSAFLERTLEHYYQRALRPSFELPCGLAQPELVRALEDQGFEKRGGAPREIFAWRPQPLPELDGRYQVRPAREEERTDFATFYAEERFREELVRYLDVAESHPNQGDRTVAYLALAGGEWVAAGLFHRSAYGSTLHGVATKPESRGRGAASALVAGVLREEGPGATLPFALSVPGGRPSPLLKLGFVPALSYDVYSLAPGRQPPGPPRG